jgi:hypothetical protein
MPDTETVQVSYRLPSDLVRRMRDIAQMSTWPPPPSQTEIVSKGIEMVLEKLEKRKPRRGKQNHQTSLR